jgi:Uma2 family endonuclease
MSTKAPTRLYTTEELLAMPDDGVERWLIRGQLREQGPEIPGVTVTVRNRHHCSATACISATLVNWKRTRPAPTGTVYSGEIGLRLGDDPDSTVAADVVYAPPEVVATQSDEDTTLLAGIPTLVVEILSPNDALDRVEEKIDTYLAAGVPLVWTVNPYRRTVMVYRPGEEPELFNRTRRLPEYPQMPGFSPTVAELFD